MRTSFPGPSTDSRKRTGRGALRCARFNQRRGVTLMEMLVVVTIIGIMVGASYIPVTAGVDSLRLSGAAEEVASFLNGALNLAERKQQAVEIAILPEENSIALASAQPGYTKRLDLTKFVTMESVLPPSPLEPAGPRRFLIYPGGTAPRIGIVLASPRGDRRVVRIDPLTGVPRVERQ